MWELWKREVGFGADIQCHERASDHAKPAPAG